MPSRAETPHPRGPRWADWAALRLVLPRVPLAVLAADDRTPPALVLEIPVHRLPEARGQAHARDEPEPLANLPRAPSSHTCAIGQATTAATRWTRGRFASGSGSSRA